MTGFVIEPDGTVSPVDPVAAVPTGPVADSERFWLVWLGQVQSACELLAIGFAQLASALRDLADGDSGGFVGSVGGPEVLEWTAG